MLGSLLMMDWVCTNCGMKRMSVDFMFLDPYYGNARCLQLQGAAHIQAPGHRGRTSGRGTQLRPDDQPHGCRIGEGIRASQRMILGALESHGPGTDEDIYGWLKLEGHKISLSGARTRRSELVRLGFVTDSGEKKMLPSRRLAIVWIKKSNSAGRESPAT